DYERLSNSLMDTDKRGTGPTNHPFYQNTSRANGDGQSLAKTNGSRAVEENRGDSSTETRPVLLAWTAHRQAGPDRGCLHDNPGQIRLACSFYLRFGKSSRPSSSGREFLNALRS